MKTIMMAAIFGCTVLAGCAQNISQAEVPSLVLNAFQQQYPQATDVEWEKQGVLYNVEFEIGKTDHELWIDALGKITRHEEDIEFVALPVKVQDAIRNNYKGAEVDDIDKIEENNQVYYLVELDHWAGDKYIKLNDQGTVIK